MVFAFETKKKFENFKFKYTLLTFQYQAKNKYG